MIRYSSWTVGDKLARSAIINSDWAVAGKAEGEDARVVVTYK
jgi:hypothetical protein